MAAKNMAQCMDAMEEMVAALQAEFQREMGRLKEELQDMNKRFEQFIQLQEVTAHANAFSSRENRVISPFIGETQGLDDSSSFTGFRHEFRYRKLEMHYLKA